MSEYSEKGPSQAELEEISLLLENRTFVDYFNTFLCLPVFGQHVFYNYMDAEFDFEPPLRNRRHLYLDRREILKWLCTERLRLFKRSALYTEYNLCMLLRDTNVDLPIFSPAGGQSTSIFTRNVLGTATGMMLFRESMRGSCGEIVYRCWKDLEAWRLIEDPVKKMYWKHVINTHYICQNSATEVTCKTKVKTFNGFLNFDLVPDEDTQQILDTATENISHSFVASDESLLKMQEVLLNALRKYWLPRHMLHILSSINKETLDKLMRPAPGDVEYLDQERRLRCNFMFPTIYQDSSVNSPATTVFESKSVGELPGDPSVALPCSPLDSEDDQTEQETDHVDLLRLWGGPAKKIELERTSASSLSSSLPEESPDLLGNRRLRSAVTSAPVTLRSPIPIVLTSYLGGKKRTLLGKFPKTTNRIIWSLASDILACCPFREFLERNDLHFDLQYLSFWTDVRNYLDTDEHVIDGYGQPLRRSLAHKIANTYLSRDGKGCEIFSEALKMSLFTAISTSNDVSLLCITQDIIQESLWEPLKLYIQDERHRFLKQVRGLRYQLGKTQRRVIDLTARTARTSKSKSASDVTGVDPMYFFNCVTVDTESASLTSSPACSSRSPCFSNLSRPGTSYHVCISEEQMWKAMEIVVLCSEFGVSMMMPQYLPTPDHLVHVIYSDYGSLHVTREPSVRHEWLNSLREKPKIDIETIKVSRAVFLEKIDLASIKNKEAEKDTEPVPKPRSRMVRRCGLNIDRPKKPKSLMEVMSTSVQFDFFKRYMMVHKMGLPVMFWKAVEDLKELSNSKTRQIRVTQIVRKFFGKYAKYGAALDCHEEIIRQIPNMEKVTPGILICAQAAVFRSLERKWYPQYLESFPPESGRSSPNEISFDFQPGVLQSFEEAAAFTQIAKKAKKKSLGSRKTMMLWRKYARYLANFCNALQDKSEAQLFELFLKYEVEREKNSPQKDQMMNQMQHIEKNIMMSNLTANVQTRIVVRNRLVIMNRLPADLRFWIEVRRYQQLVDSALQKGSVSILDTEFLCDKARSIIACYLASEIMPKVQVNIANDMATNIINSLASNGATRGLFHEAIVQIFPILYHYYRKFSEDWMKGNIPDEYFDSIEMLLKDRVASTPHNEEKIPDYKQLRSDQFKTTTHIALDENMMKIHFSLSDGVTLIYPQAKVYTHKSNTGQGRRMTKHSVHALIEEPSPHKENTDSHGDRKGKGEKRPMKSGDKLNKSEDTGKPFIGNVKDKRKSEKIVVKESDLVERNSLKDDKETEHAIDKTHRLSALVDKLNREKERKVREQNRRFNTVMTFSEVVTAAATLAESSSIFS